MTISQRVRSFEFRPSRVKTEFYVELLIGQEKVTGVCLDVCEEGILARLSVSQEIGGVGVLVLHHSTGTLSVEAQVAHADKGATGLTFLFKTVSERAMTLQFVAAMSNDLLRD